MTNLNVLSLNGGGARGLIALYILNELYRIEPKEFFRKFDYIGGTSTGSLMGALMVKGYNPSECIDIYMNHLPKIFDKRCLSSVRGISKYNNEYLKGLANELLGNDRLGDLKQKLVVPALNVSTEEPKYFKSYDLEDMDFKLVDVVVASSAAPTYFPAYEIKGNWYVDGGLAANNPAQILLKECQGLPDVGKINILSITTGSVKTKITNAEKKGNLFSIPSLIDNMLKVQDKVTHGSVLKDYKNKKAIGSYIRCTPKIDKSTGEIDDVSSTNIAAMCQDGLVSAEINKKLISLYNLNTLSNE